MIWQDYHLDNVVMKANDTVSLWRTERGYVEINKDALAVTVTVDGKPKGYIFSGNGKLVLDAIVETEQGAVGKSVERELKEPFLMLANSQDIAPHLSKADSDDQKDFLNKAEELFDRFFSGRRGISGFHCCHHDRSGSIFAFQNENSHTLDLLVLDKSKLVYKADQMTFVQNENRAILKSPKHIVIAGDRRSIFIK